MRISGTDDHGATKTNGGRDPRLPLSAAAAVIAAGSALGWAALIWLAAAI